MRVNVYAEELTQDVQIVEKNGHHGLRFYLHSPHQLHHRPDDDDRSAITLWGLDTVQAVLNEANKLFHADLSREP